MNRDHPPEIQTLGPGDYDDIIALWRRTGLHSTRVKGRDSRDAMARQMASGVQTILGLRIDGALVGVVVASHDSRKGWINRLAVDPDYRRKGFGALLIAAAETTLRRQGLRIIAALIEADNPNSLALFAKAGYREHVPGIHYVTKRDSDDV